MVYPVNVYVDAHGAWCGARLATTDMVSVGLWDVSQLRYRPFIDALNIGVDEARAKLPQRRLGRFSAAQFEIMPVGVDVGRPGKRINPKTVEAMRLHLVEGLSVSEAARRCGWHRANVQRALRALNRRMLCA